MREGLNFRHPDYLSLASHPERARGRGRRAPALRRAQRGLVGAAGALDASRLLELEIGEALQMEHVSLFSSGWGAASRSRRWCAGRPHRLTGWRTPRCRPGAAATRQHRPVEHLASTRRRRALADLRAVDTMNGILVITEGLFSMDSDSPDLVAMQAVCREYQATLFVDVAHDFGSLGPGGTGHVGRCGMLGAVDIVMGAFSKTLASNGGFVASRSPGVRTYIEAYGGPFTFSNALSPIQVATVREALRIARSAEGDARRAALMANVSALRGACAERGLKCLGDPSAVVPC
jgi:7-keto-8-aminopelargonate synthetase-like enzyme